MIRSTVLSAARRNKGCGEPGRGLSLTSRQAPDRPAADAKRQVCSLVNRSQFDMLRPRRGEGMRWFLSYHTPDHPLAERLKAAIEGKDDPDHAIAD